MIVKLLTEHHLEFLSLKGGCSGSSESTHVKMPHCWKSHVTACYSAKSGIKLFKPSADVSKTMILYHYNKMASSRENLSSGCPTKRVPNQSPQLQ